MESNDNNNVDIPIDINSLFTMWDLSFRFEVIKSTFKRRHRKDTESIYARNGTRTA